jgi:hypothetical protein
MRKPPGRPNTKKVAIRTKKVPQQGRGEGKGATAKLKAAEQRWAEDKEGKGKKSATEQRQEASKAQSTTGKRKSDRLAGGVLHNTPPYIGEGRALRLPRPNGHDRSPHRFAARNTTVTSARSSRFQIGRNQSTDDTSQGQRSDPNGPRGKRHLRHGKKGLCS